MSGSEALECVWQDHKTTASSHKIRDDGGKRQDKIKKKKKSKMEQEMKKWEGLNKWALCHYPGRAPAMMPDDIKPLSYSLS